LERAVFLTALFFICNILVLGMADVRFLKSVYEVGQIPKLRLPEVVLCGRSNVGKSSFINSFFNRKNLAKVSSSPGKTRSINYYVVENKYYIVDLPGFGYAKTSKKEQARWERMITDYLAKSGHIEFALHFVDSRHKPTELDMRLREFLSAYEIPYKIVLTKTDKLKQSEFARAKKLAGEYFPEALQSGNIFFYSAIKGTGKKELKKLFYEEFKVSL
jgi:GTP-binding protein